MAISRYSRASSLVVAVFWMARARSTSDRLIFSRVDMRPGDRPWADSSAICSRRDFVFAGSGVAAGGTADGAASAGAGGGAAAVCSGGEDADCGRGSGRDEKTGGRAFRPRAL
jgi:hypothetical protein